MLRLDGLNDAQRSAVLHTEGPLLVLAGAGSGKTRVITYRLARLISIGVSPRNVLCVTFTNKAAFEMRARAKALVGRGVRGATMSTFHALGSRIIREHPERVGLRKGFTISDGSDQVGYLRRLLRELRIDDRRFDAKRIMAMISRAKNAGLDAADFRAAGGRVGDAPDEAHDEEYTVAAIEAYERYERGLRAQNVVDFDDLLLLTLRLLGRDEEVRGALQDRWRYLMIDEYQDTNGAQLELMRLLAGDRKNLCVVGDDDQSIYGWRGADIRNILSFDQHFAGARVVKLEMNYRSTGAILDCANAVIAVNEVRHDKTLQAAAGFGHRVMVVGVEDEDAEAEQVAQAVEEILAHGALPKEIAVLFRSNVQSRAIELAFRAKGIAYRVAGGMELFDRREVKDMLCYLRVLDNPDDEQSLRRIVNFPPRGIGDTTLEKVDDWARQHDLTLHEGLSRVDEVPGLSPRATDAIHAFVSLIAEHRRLLGRRKPSTVAAALFEAVGIEEALLGSSDSAQVASRRVDNVREILRQMGRWEDRLRKERRKVERTPDESDLDADQLSEATLDGFLADLALGARDDGQTAEDREDQIVLSTIHAAKGLEWKHVYLVGAEEELLPHLRTLEGEGEIEEERRLAYVAITRAREHLTITWARTRSKWGRIVPRTRSRFLDDLPPHAADFEEDEVTVERSPEESEALAQRHIAAIWAKLGKDK